eukprot:gene9837-10848_t
MTTTKQAAIQFGVRYLTVIALICIGGLIFASLENVGVEEEIELIKKQSEINDKARERLRNDLATQLNATVNATVFNKLFKELRQLNDKEKPNKWDFATGSSFTFTIVSTVGYGVIVPKKDASRIMCIIYAMIGIPIYLYALSAAGTLKKKFIEALIYLCEIKIMKRPEIRKMNTKTMVLTVFLFVVEMLILSGIASTQEPWTYFESIYYWFITASTIGFGDYVLGFNGNNQMHFGNQLLALLSTLILQSGLATIFETGVDVIKQRAERRGHNKCGCFRKRKKMNLQSHVNSQAQLQDVDKA